MENKKQNIELADVFSQHATTFLSAHTLSSTQQKALKDIVKCRTSELGGHVEKCDHCGYIRQSYNSCRNRHCPKCQFVKKSAAKAGIRKNISFHTLRHCFATHLLEAGVNIRLIQQFMGHTSIKTTTIYLHLANINPASVQSPLDSMNI